MRRKEKEEKTPVCLDSIVLFRRDEPVRTSFTIRIFKEFSLVRIVVFAKDDTHSNRGNGYREYTDTYIYVYLCIYIYACILPSICIRNIPTLETNRG